MRNIKKRLTCVNRGPSQEQQKQNEIAIMKIATRYTEKMINKGWKIYSFSTGDSFLHYEAIVRMYK